MKFSAFIHHMTYLGFSEKEARVYLACLEAGQSASVASIAETAGVKRATAYVMLKSLALKGLVGPAASGKKSNVCAMPPHRILQMLEEEKKAAEIKHGAFSTVLPEMLAMLSGPHLVAEEALAEEGE